MEDARDASELFRVAAGAAAGTAAGAAAGEDAALSRLVVDGFRDRPLIDARDFSGRAATDLDPKVPGAGARDGVVAEIEDDLSGLLGVRDRVCWREDASACCRKLPRAPYRWLIVVPGPIEARPRSVRFVGDGVRPGVDTSSIGRNDGKPDRIEFVVARKFGAESSWLELDGGRLGGRDEDRWELLSENPKPDPGREAGPPARLAGRPERLTGRLRAAVSGS